MKVVECAAADKTFVLVGVNYAIERSAGNVEIAIVANVIDSVATKEGAAVYRDICTLSCNAIRNADCRTFYGRDIDSPRII